MASLRTVGSRRLLLRAAVAAGCLLRPPVVELGRVNPLRGAGGGGPLQFKALDVEAPDLLLLAWDFAEVGRISTAVFVIEFGVEQRTLG